MFKGVRHTKFSVVKVLLLNSIQYITGEHPELVYVMKQWIQEQLNAFFFFSRILKINC